MPGPRETNSENCFREFTAYFDKKLGQKDLIRLFFLLRTNQPATWLKKRQWRGAVAQWEGLSAAPSG